MDATGHPDEALRAIQEAHSIVDRKFPFETRLSMLLTQDLADRYAAIGDYPRAEPLYKRLLEMREKVKGPEHVDTASTLVDLGDVYNAAGQYQPAEELFARALSIRERALGPEHLDTADCIYRLASIHTANKDFESAEKLLVRVLDIYSAALGADHVDTAVIIAGLGLLHSKRADYPRASELLERALAIQEKHLDPDDIALAWSRGALAASYVHSGRLSAALPLYTLALASFEKSLGVKHPTTGEFAALFTHALVRTGDLEAARDVGQKAEQSWLAAMQTMLAFGSEQQRLLFQFRRDPYHPATALGDSEAIATLMLRFKGIVLDSILEDRRLARSSGDDRRLGLLRELREVKQQRLGAAVLRSDTARQQTKLLEQRIAQIERTLARDDQDVGRTRQALTLQPAQVQAALVPGSALVDFLRYQQYPAGARIEIAYGAIVLPPRGRPIWLPLGSGPDIDEKVTRYQQAMRESRGGEELERTLRELHDQVWAPVEAALPPDTRHIVISPDGILNLVSFASLVAKDDSFLVERYTLSYTASGRDLLAAPEATESRDVVIYANPDFLAAGDPAVRQEPTPAVSAPEAEQATTRRDVGRLGFTPLPGSAREGERLAIQARSAGQRVIYLEGTYATEAALRGMRAPRILHIATHGFFFSDSNDPDAKNESLDVDTRGIGGVRPVEPRSAELEIPSLPSPIQLPDPMLRSGLALSGAQRTLAAWARGEVPDTESDGILMAEEVTQLDLTGTWLVTLSSCDSGVGAVRSGEGVLGLWRGFAQTGARNLLMALWPVLDRQTVDFMAELYAALDGEHASPAEALRHVQRDWLVRVRAERGISAAVRVAGPFVVSSVGPPITE